MPNRIIHEKALRSGSLAKLSAHAERLFWRLMVVADDQGRFDAFPATVKANCFPRLVDEIKTKDVLAWMAELGAECCKFYTVDGGEYGYFVKWAEYQRIYGNKPKFPQPPADCGSSPQIPALILNSSSTTTSTPITTTTCPSVMNGDFELFWEVYPKKTGKKAALQAWNKAKDRPPVADIIQAIEMQNKTQQWMKENGQFIPNPSTWLNQGRWDDDVTAMESAVRRGMNSFLERHKEDA